MSTSFSQISTISASILLKSARSIVGTSSIYGSCSHVSWKRAVIYTNIINSSSLGSSVWSRLGAIQYYCTKPGASRKRKSIPELATEDEKEAYFVVRKGDVVGVYKSLSDCQAQVGSSICDPPVSVYKGYSLSKEAEDHLVSRGLQNALHTIIASDLNGDLFGSLVPCPFQEPESLKGATVSIDIPEKRPHDMAESENLSACLLEFDGASKGNPGPAGAGAVLRTVSGHVICKIRQGLGTATNNVAEYQALILGLKKALEMGYTSIRARGDSKLVCMQLQGLWKVKNQNMSDLHAEATKLMEKFSFFQIGHVLRELNSDADAEANLAVSLPNGQVQENLG